MGDIVPIIMCGGEGRRLWPLSTPIRPKPFHALGTQRTLLEEALLRCRGPGLDARPIIVTHCDMHGLARQAADTTGVACDFVLEPAGRNSAAAAIAGCLRAEERHPGGTALILAADHFIDPVAVFQAAVARGEGPAHRGKLVLFGVTPRSADPAFGYIVPASGQDQESLRPVQRFVEKPCASEAEQLLALGAFWNSGNFLVRSDVLLGLAARHAPQVWAAVSIATQQRTIRDGAWLMAPDSHAAAPALSLDHAVVARCDDVAVLPVTFQWRDLGTWRSVDGHLKKDANSNHAGSAKALGCENVTVVKDDSEVTVIGCRDLMVVVSEGRVLVASKQALQHTDFPVE